MMKLLIFTLFNLFRKKSTITSFENFSKKFLIPYAIKTSLWTVSDASYSFPKLAFTPTRKTSNSISKSRLKKLSTI